MKLLGYDVVKTDQIPGMPETFDITKEIVVAPIGERRGEDEILIKIKPKG
jgi:hypothetical protein